jgi:Ca2+-binding EF-hand superfamily protein
LIIYSFFFYIQELIDTIGKLVHIDKRLDVKLTLKAMGFEEKKPVNYEKFLTIVKKFEKIQQIDQTFSFFDKNHDGRITFEELKIAMSSLGFILSNSQIKDMMCVADKNNDGKVIS